MTVLSSDALPITFIARLPKFSDSNNTTFPDCTFKTYPGHSLTTSTLLVSELTGILFSNDIFTSGLLLI